MSFFLLLFILISPARPHPLPASIKSTRPPGDTSEARGHFAPASCAPVPIEEASFPFCLKISWMAFRSSIRLVGCFFSIFWCSDLVILRTSDNLNPSLSSLCKNRNQRKSASGEGGAVVGSSSSNCKHPLPSSIYLSTNLYLPLLTATYLYLPLPYTSTSTPTLPHLTSHPPQHAYMPRSIYSYWGYLPESNRSLKDLQIISSQTLNCKYNIVCNVCILNTKVSILLFATSKFEMPLFCKQNALAFLDSSKKPAVCCLPYHKVLLVKDFKTNYVGFLMYSVANHVVSAFRKQGFSLVFLVMSLSPTFRDLTTFHAYILVDLQFEIFTFGTQSSIRNKRPPSLKPQTEKNKNISCSSPNQTEPKQSKATSQPTSSPPFDSLQTRDVPGQHAAVGRLDVASDQRHTDAG